MSAVELVNRLDAVLAAAADWRDPDHETRASSVRATLETENSFTEEALAFAINQQMSLLTRENLEAWIGGRHAPRSLLVGVLNAGNIPLVGLQDFLAVTLTGHAYLGSESSKSPVLLPAFVDDVAARCATLTADFAEAKDLFVSADVLIATGSEETADWVHEQSEEHDIQPHRRLVRGHRFAVAVLDGSETDDEYELIAEDILLHEGFGCRNVAVVWAPAKLAPDDLLEAMARFRGVFPAHESTPRRLKMPQAFLEAVGAPHAHGEGLEFLMSKGEPEVQQPGHVRWSEYESLSDVREWLQENAGSIQLIVAKEELIERLDTGLPIERLGHAQRPQLDWCPDGIDTVEFLVSLR